MSIFRQLHRAADGPDATGAASGSPRTWRQNSLATWKGLTMDSLSSWIGSPTPTSSGLPRFVRQSEENFRNAAEIASWLAATRSGSRRHPRINSRVTPSAPLASRLTNRRIAEVIVERIA